MYATKTKQQTPISKIQKLSSAEEEVLLYGMDEAREAMFPNLIKSHPNKKFVSIDDLNYYVGIASESLQANYPGLLEKIKNFNSLTAEQRRLYDGAARDMSKVSGIDLKRCIELLRSWRDFLSTRASALQISALATTAKTKKVSKESVYHFLNKNAQQKNDKNTESSAKDFMLDFLKKPSSEKGNMDLRRQIFSNETVNSAVHNAFFRRTSKLALEWASENNIPVVFVESTPEMSGTGKSSGHGNRFAPVKAEVLSANRKKAYAKKDRVASYEPITFSEMRYYRRKGLGNVHVVHLSDET